VPSCNGISLLTVGLYLQLINTKCVFTFCKLLTIYSETIKCHAFLHTYYLINNYKMCCFYSTITNCTLFFISIHNVPIKESFVYLVGQLEGGLGTIRCSYYEYVIFVVSSCLSCVAQQMISTCVHRQMSYFIQE
jgi:hypothetical protein